jgi:hypothetical protein
MITNNENFDDIKEMKEMKEMKEEIVKKKFDDIGISTETIIGKTNAKINISELYKMLPCVDYRLEPKKRGRRPKDEKKIDPPVLNEGDITYLEFEDEARGTPPKSKRKKNALKDDKNDKKDKKNDNKKNDNYFRNSLTIVMWCGGKLINFKISKNGKFQFTGCKNDNNAHSCLTHIIRYINEASASGNKKILTIPQSVNMEVIYITVMANINFSLGFCVNKENLDDYVNKNTEYYSLLETNFGYTGVNIKIPLPNLNDVPITKMIFDRQTNEWTRLKMTYSEYFLTLDDKERTKEKNKTRYNTFLVFQSGNVILSSPHKECMRNTYHEFLNIIQTSRNFIEEKIVKAVKQ